MRTLLVLVASLASAADFTTALGDAYPLYRRVTRGRPIFRWAKHCGLRPAASVTVSVWVAP